MEAWLIGVTIACATIAIISIAGCATWLISKDKDLKQLIIKWLSPSQWKKPKKNDKTK